MKKFYIRMLAANALPHDARTISFYSPSVGDALDYVCQYELHYQGRHTVQVFDTEMNELFCVTYNFWD